jgi:hypothetical protein
VTATIKPDEDVQCTQAQCGDNGRTRFTFLYRRTRPNGAVTMATARQTRSSTCTQRMKEQARIATRYNRDNVR